MRQLAGADIRFELGKEWCERYDGKLQVAHGHMDDPANGFADWQDPIRVTDVGTLRLEMCPGTLFMVKFVNKLEDDYPFADNLLPVTKLASVLLREDKWGLASIGWMFAKFCATSPTALEAKASQDYGARLLTRFRDNAQYAKRLATALAKNAGKDSTSSVSLEGLTQSKLAALMFQLLGRIDAAEWEALFGLPAAGTMGVDEATLFAVTKSNFDDSKEKLRAVAQGKIDAGASVVVMGHTHQPDKVDFKGGGSYYNPGCWTRYLELKPGQKITLSDLEDESRYPYELNFVRVEIDGKGGIESKMHCFESGN